MASIHGGLLAVLLATLTPTLAWVPTHSHNIMHRSSTDASFKTTQLTAEQGDDDTSDAKYSGYNVLGTELSCCCSNVRETGIGTGFYRNGFCSTGDNDVGRHTVCVQVTEEFLSFSKSVGNDLSTPMPEYLFPGLKEGDRWCLCAQRWAQAYNAGKAPKLFLQSTHEKTLDFIPFDVMKIFAIDAEESASVINKLDLQRSQLNEILKKDVTDNDEAFQ
mmetsp:Transcript_8861/g.17633  ORF Transcript_8861/g.17633 Transcript_8861/m.17633 type:complete len:218 (-) Transcript_8861:27-680(-)